MASFEYYNYTSGAKKILILRPATNSKARTPWRRTIRMGPDLLTGSWPPISSLETSDQPMPISAGPLSTSCSILLIVLCLGLMLQSSKSKPTYRADEEDCLDPKTPKGGVEASEPSGPIHNAPQTGPQHQLTPIFVFSREDSTSNSSNRKEARSKRTTTTYDSSGSYPGHEHRNSSTRRNFSLPISEPSRYLHMGATYGPLVEYSMTPQRAHVVGPTREPPRRQSISSDDDPYPPTRISMASDDVGFRDSAVDGRRQGLSLGTRYEPSYVPSMVVDKRTSHGPY
ncbi:hypothetical protein B0J11DRAFT_579485 [Dendryphion nanum]|uniref:Uncharacterized protein n=1 Tax=Dendryphion nanum TaxID=256645 RepID=A0A9P9DXV6_9PLEO|nr:hypothetical protein B0J11DRAFT_579485 [Dendryphion nanum]